MRRKRKADSRIPRTRAAIRKAYLGLLGQKDAADITVTDVAQAAALDRKTIYNYYPSVSAIIKMCKILFCHPFWSPYCASFLRAYRRSSSAIPSRSSKGRVFSPISSSLKSETTRKRPF